MFHILPKLQAKRADFLTVMLTGSLHQRRAFTATPPETQDEGPQDDDVTKSESSSGASEKSTERSQDGAPSTLVADDPHKGAKEPGSVADVDPDQEDVSKTLVLFSPGDMKKSPNAVNGTEVDQVLAGSGAPQNEQLDEGGPLELQEDIKQVQMPTDTRQPDTVDLGSSIQTSKAVVAISTTSVASASLASPPFFKVERTFIHIAETSHLNIMSSNGGQIRGSDPEVLAIAEKVQVEGRSQTKQITEQGVHFEVTSQTLTEEPQVLKILDESLPNETFDKHDSHIVPVSSETKEPIQQESSIDGDQENQPKEGDQEKKPSPESVAGSVKLSKHPRPRSMSRIPLLLSEEDAGSEQCLSTRERLRRRAMQQDLARQVVERQRQGHSKRLNSRSSLSSGDEPKRASETLSVTGSEEDIYEADESLNKLKKEAKEKNVTGWHSRIPRPVTPIRRPLTKLTVASPGFVVLPGPGTAVSEQKASNGPKVESQSSAPLPARSKSTLSRSAVTNAGNRTRLSCIPATSRRSLSAANGTFSSSRIASPSPQRPALRTAVSESRKQPFVLRAAVELTVKSRTTSRSGPARDQNPQQCTNAPGRKPKHQTRFPLNGTKAQAPMQLQPNETP